MKWPLGSHMLASTRSKVLAAFSSVMAIALFALLLPSTAAAGPGGASTSTLQDGGVLRLHLGAADSLSFQKPDPLNPGQYLPVALGDTQSVSTSSGCKLSLNPTNNLVSFAPPFGNSPSPYAGFVSDAIGVGSNGEGNGQPCGRIDLNQQLAMRLGTGLSGKAIDYAEIDLEGKFGANVVVDGYLVNATTPCPPSSGTPATSETYNTTGSDSGPDSADGDNYRIRFPKASPDANTHGASPKTLVNCLAIRPTAGGASLEGGADGTAPCDASDPTECGGIVPFSLGGPTNLNTTDTLFHLIDADGVLNCGQTAPPQGGGTTPTNSLERLNNVDNATCTPIPYNLDSSTTNCNPLFPQCVLLQKDLLEQNAQFYWTVTWAPEGGEYMETETEFDFGFGFQKLQLCLADDGDADPYPELPPKATDSPAGSPDPDPWCVVNTATVLNTVTGQVTVTEKYFGSGDPGGARH